MHGGGAAVFGLRGDFGKASGATGGEQEAGSFGGEGESSGSADAGAGSGDEDDLSFKTHDNILANWCVGRGDGCYGHSLAQSCALIGDLISRDIESATLLGDAVLAYGPVLVCQAGLPGLLKNFSEIVGQAEAGVAGSGRLAEHPRVLGAEADAGARRVPGGWSITLPYAA